MTYPLTDNLKARDASASKKAISFRFKFGSFTALPCFFQKTSFAQYEAVIEIDSL